MNCTQENDETGLCQLYPAPRAIVSPWVGLHWLVRPSTDDGLPQIVKLQIGKGATQAMNTKDHIQFPAAIALNLY